MLERRATAGGPVRINEEVRLFLTGLFALEPKPEPPPPCEPPEGFVWVPPGEFILGGKNGLDVQIARLDEGFFAARTPVTNAEFARFLDDGGYDRPGCWTEAGWKEKESRGWTRPNYWEDRRFNDPSQPVVGISWYEALAYCNWLAAKTGRHYRLPTEQEWEKAARGYDGREYPWGEWAEGRCNTKEAGIGRTTPVGQFSPDGNSPYGLQDAAGNVWEWMASEEGALRVLRGGSFDYDRVGARCASRDGSYPNHRRSWHLGFRLVVSPISPPLPSGTLDLPESSQLSGR